MKGFKSYNLGIIEVQVFDTNQFIVYTPQGQWNSKKYKSFAEADKNALIYLKKLEKEQLK